MFVFTEEIGYNERSAGVLVTPSRPSPSHADRSRADMADPQSTTGVLCECGCGLPTNRATRTRPQHGWVKGEPVRFLRGHCLPKAKDIDSLYAINATTSCWEWTGNREAGYGRIGNRLAYRVMYERERGAVPHGLELDHLCRNRACVNPDHLEPVTRTVNVRRGAKAKLTQADVFRIHQLASEGHTQAAIAAAIGGISPNLVSKVVAGHIWRDVFDAVKSGTPSTRVQTYDDRQIGAVLKVCVVCGQDRYFVNHAATTCGGCR